MGFNITELQGSNVAAIIAALQALCPDLVTTSQKGLLAPDAEAIQAGFIKLATSSNKGLMSKAFAAILENPEKIVFTPGLSLTQNAGYHNSIYRGKYLGTSVSAAQYAAISAGTFDDLFIGDYWTINGVNWRIAAFDYWYNCGDTACTTHHVVIVPDSNLTSGGLNSTNITTGAYVGSDFYTGNNSNTMKSTMNTAINNAFGSGHILSHREYLANATTSGYQSAGAWYGSTADLMTEQMVYGGKVFGSRSAGTNIPADYTIGHAQLPLFALDHARICNRANWWLRDVVSATTFAIVTNDGNAACNTASVGYGIRPAFGIRA